MFLKPLRRKKGDKAHTYWALVESVRTERGPRHRVVSYLGEIEATDQERWARLAQEGLRASGQGDLFETPSGSPDYVTVDVKGLRITRVREFGPLWLGTHLWHLLRLGDFFEGVLPAGREDVSWGLVAQILTLARLCAPGSELAIEERWYRKTALPDLLGVSEDKVNTDRLYRALDAILPHKQALEKHLKERLGTLFDVKFDVLLYDVTSTFFEGQAAGNPQALRGHSRDQRHDCKQVCIALVVTPEGLPLAYEVFDGNRVDVTTVEDIVGTVEAKYGRAQRVWVMDRGMVSEDNLEFLREREGLYLVGTPKQSLRKFESHLTEKGWVEAQPGVEVKTVASPDGDETFILCRSRDRAQKEHAMYDRFVKRITEALTKMKTSVENGRQRNAAKIERRIGALLSRNSRGARAFDVQLKRDGKKLRLEWSLRKDLEEWARLSEGFYILRTNLPDRDPAKLWRTYIQLTEAEAAFRTLKSDLVIRPIWHQKEERVQAHILVCFLAYVLWKSLQQWMHVAGLGDNPRVLLDQVQTLKCVDLEIPTREGKTLRLTCISEPEKELTQLLARLKLMPPKRMRPRDIEKIASRM